LDLDDHGFAAGGILACLTVLLVVTTIRPVVRVSVD
jgi:hypothetical protein